jgi:hypothetical protein
MLLLPEGQKGEDWDLSKNKPLSEMGEHLVEKYFHFF